MVYNNLIKKIIELDGKIKPLLIDSKLTNGTGLCNPSLLYNDDKLHMILRHVEYTLYSCENKEKFQSRYEGPLSYYHRDDDIKLRTNNYYCTINLDTLEITKTNKIDTSNFDSKPLWSFIGLEDARLVFWNNKYYGVGVRRDTTTNGQGRIEFSEIKIQEDNVIEVARNRIEVKDKDSYCEKNWMPIKSKPFTFIKWTNPTEVVEVNLDKNIAKQIYSNNKIINLPFDLRGGSQLIDWDNETYLSIVHECKFTAKNFNGYKNGSYYHRFIIWNKDYSIKYISHSFNFMTAKIEFCIGLEKINNDIYIAYSFNDNGSYLLKLSKDNLTYILNDVLGEVKNS